MRRFNKSVRTQIRLIAEAIDDEPKLFGIKIVPGKHPIDQLIMAAQQNMFKWSWNDNKFIKAMRDAYHNAGMTVPANREQLVKDLQKQSEQDPKLLDQLISGLGGMSRRHFMGLSAGAGAGVATGMIDFAPHEKSVQDKSLKVGQHYRVTYRNFRNETRVWKDLIFSEAGGQMYWFEDPRTPKFQRDLKKARRYRRRTAWRTMTPQEQLQRVAYHQQQIQEITQILNGRVPYRHGRPERKYRGYTHEYTLKAKPTLYVTQTWPKTIARLQNKIKIHQQRAQYWQRASEAPMSHKRITLQIANVVEMTPLG